MRIGKCRPGLIFKLVLLEPLLRLLVFRSNLECARHPLASKLLFEVDLGIVGIFPALFGLDAEIAPVGAAQVARVDPIHGPDQRPECVARVVFPLNVAARLVVAADNEVGIEGADIVDVPEECVVVQGCRTHFVSAAGGKRIKIAVIRTFFRAVADFAAAAVGTRGSATAAEFEKLEGLAASQQILMARVDIGAAEIAR